MRICLKPVFSEVPENGGPDPALAEPRRDAVPANRRHSGNLPPDAVFFEQSPISAEELDDFKLLVERLKKKKLHELEDDDHRKLLELALRFTPGVHKMAALPEILETLILEGRALFREKLPRMTRRHLHSFRCRSISTPRRS